MEDGNTSCWQLMKKISTVACKKGIGNSYVAQAAAVNNDATRKVDFDSNFRDMGHNKYCEFLARPLNFLVVQPAHVPDTPDKEEKSSSIAGGK
eukprot:scaffold44009_cov73-Attheya_sp.AAC.1